MTPHELKILQQIHRRMLALEREAGISGFQTAAAEAELEGIQKDLLVFAGHKDLAVRKVSDIAHHLHSGMTLKSYVTWLVPLERLLQKELRDDEFLILTDDHTVALAEKIPLSFVLHNLRSAFNVGSIFRTAECFGVEKIFLCGYTPLPSQEKLAKTAMGTAALVSWQEEPKILDLLQRLRGENHRLVALETTTHAVDLQTEFAFTEPTVFVFGNERFGVDADILDLCHEVRRIPLRGQKNSLNVSNATAIATYEFSRQFAARGFSK